MMMMSMWMLASATMLAGDPGTIAQSLPPEPQPITGGQTVNTCGWPSTVLLSGNGFICSGNLIHPQVVATAAHCVAVMEPETLVRFGDTANSAQDLVPVDFCMGSPDYEGNDDGTIPFDQVQNDWGFCVLSEPITTVEPIPVAYGCEMDQVAEGNPIVRVGFGSEILGGGQHFKRWVETQINTVPFTDPVTGWATQLTEAGGGEGTCPGDSGGPSFIMVPTPDGGESWRMVAIQSTQPVEDGKGGEIECGTEPNNTAVFAQGVAFVEEQSGIDITPCHDVDGTWNPTFDCQAFPMDPGQGGGTWAMGCEAGPLSGFEGTCGATFDELVVDEDPPSVSLVEPPDDLVIEWEGEPVIVDILAEATDGDGWGMARVDLEILDGDTGDSLGVFEDLEEAYEWSPTFPQGHFEIRAIGYDNAGFVAETDTRAIWVGVEPPAADTGGDDDDDDDEAGSSGGIGETGADGTGGDAGAEEDEGGAEDEDEGDDEGSDETGVDSAGAGDGDRGSGDEGCGCRSTRPVSGSGIALGLLALLGFTRRRRD